MRKHSGGTSRRDYRFDWLEERSLLSGNFPAANFQTGGFASPPLPMEQAELIVPMVRGLEITVSLHWGSPFQADPSPQAPTNDLQLPGPEGFAQGPALAAVPLQAIVSASVPVSVQIPVRGETGQLTGPPGSSGSPEQYSDDGSAKSQSGTIAIERDGGGRVSVSAQSAGIVASADGAAIPAGKEGSQETAGNANGQLEAAAMSLPAQIVALLDQGALVNGRLEVQSLTDAGFDRLSATAMAGMIGSAIDPQASALIGPSALELAPDGSPRASGGTASLPNPHMADLIASALPGDRGALDRALDQFFTQVDDPDGRGAGGQGPARIVLFSAVLAGSFAGLDVVRRRWRHWKAGDHVQSQNRSAGGDHTGFPELPGNWYSRPK